MFKNEWGDNRIGSQNKSIFREIADVFGPEFKKMWKNLNENANLEIDGHLEENRIPRWWPKRGGDCGFEKTVDDVMVSKIDKCEELVDGTVQHEVDGHRERGAIPRSGPSVDGSAISENLSMGCG